MAEKSSRRGIKDGDIAVVDVDRRHQVLQVKSGNCCPKVQETE